MLIEVNFWRKQKGKKVEEEIEQRIRQIHGLDKKAMKEAGKRWDQIAKPLNSLGLLEEMLIQIAGISGSSQICLDKKAVLVFAEIMELSRRTLHRPGRR